MRANETARSNVLANLLDESKEAIAAGAASEEIGAEDNAK